MKKMLFFLFLSFNIQSAKSAEILVWKEDADTITIDRYSIQKIFTKKISRWPNGTNINVFIKPRNSIEHRDFVTNVLMISPHYFDELLERQTYTGKATPVIEVPSDKLMQLKIESTPGAIGYINYDLYYGSKRIIVIDPETIQN